MSDVSSGRPPIILFVYGDVTLRENGAQVRICEQIGYFSAQYPGTIVYSYAWHPSHPWSAAGQERFQRAFPDANLVLDRPGRSVRVASRVKNSLISLLPVIGSWTMRWAVPGATPALHEFRKHEDVPWIVNYVDGLGWLNGLPRGPIFLETHDIKALKFARRYHRATTSFRVRAKLRSEAALLKLSRAILAIGVKDAAFFRSLVPTIPTLFVPSYENRASHEVRISDKGDIDLLFVASENPFNVAGFLRFWEEAQSWRDRYRFALAGKICSVPSIRAAVGSDPRVTMLGFVDDLSPVYASSRATISPVDGTGLKIKIVDALSHGRPVFASDESLDGLPEGYEACVFPISEESISHLLGESNGDRLVAAQREACIYYERFNQSGDRGVLLSLLESSRAEGLSTRG